MLRFRVRLSDEAESHIHHERYEGIIPSSPADLIRHFIEDGLHIMDGVEVEEIE